MKKRYFIIILLISFIIEISVTIILLNNNYNYKNDTVKINELIYDIKNNFNDESKYPNYYSYSIIDELDNLIYKNSPNASTSLNLAYQNKDTIIDITIDNKEYKILLINDIKDIIKNNNIVIIITISVISLIQIFAISMYYIYLHKNIIKPFDDMKEYATRISNGNLDIPLTMDKNNNFGAFTESFDIMRVELKKARLNEKKANDSKKELIAKLSHDIKTPIASIKSTSELGIAISNDKDDINKFEIINNKADQINTLVSNLLMSSLDDLEQIQITPTACDSYILYDLIKNSDYLNKTNKYNIIQCKIYADRLRLQQVFDNVFMNSYKYANTNIEININIDNEYLLISIKDFGNTIEDNEIPLLMEKYKRGNNIKDKEGSGLGLYISKRFIEQMNGKIEIKNDKPGFNVLLYLRII